MVVSPSIELSTDRELVAQVGGVKQTLLKNVPANVTVRADGGNHGVPGAFIGAFTDSPSSRHKFPIGKLVGDCKFNACFRFKLWWMSQRMGTTASEIPVETQFLLVQTPGNAGSDAPASKETVYTVFLPVLEGAFRASLSGSPSDELNLIVESGDAAVQTDMVSSAVYVHSGSDPFAVISDAIRAVEEATSTFNRRAKKTMPKCMDYFGWCTWDAFYTKVTAESLSEGLKSLAEGGTPARFLIIDDGWQSIAADSPGEGEPTTQLITEGTQFASRLTSIKENHKFNKVVPVTDATEPKSELERLWTLADIVKDVKSQHDLKFVFVWHALAGYWGGVRPNHDGLEHYEAAIRYPTISPGVLENQPCMALDSLALHGIGLVHPKKAFNFFDELHEYLASAGVDGVKVDVQSILEALGEGLGGRVALARMYHGALEASVKKNFPDNGCISCMSHSSDGIYSSKQTAIVRASDDFWPRDPASHTIHIASVAYNSLFLGEFAQPDWDMFQSLHTAGAYHAAARAIGGCGIYVSDKPGQHDFELLRKLVLPDGRTLRAQLPGRPTRDCLFNDPARDGVSMLKIWNKNLYGGVIGAFNCQGAAWCKDAKHNRIHDEAPQAVASTVRPTDVEGLAELAGDTWTGDVAVYKHQGDELLAIPASGGLAITLPVLNYELFTVAPITELPSGVRFAPIGLLSMFNPGGAVVGMSISDTSVALDVRGCGRFGMWASDAPVRCALGDGTPLKFDYDKTDSRLTVELPAPEAGEDWRLEVTF
eukprot:TRINITY_DN248_c0_g1_i3.p1 TRINITY_DN248_c0_g1~~TRINITY_DN248_c0_g1_i3.p1  ORF type:complete len:767 (+),score=194.64 TRINITY_DN248_c0_g1_i3:795-3095(+)